LKKLGRHGGGGRLGRRKGIVAGKLDMSPCLKWKTKSLLQIQEGQLKHTRGTHADETAGDGRQMAAWPRRERIDTDG